MRVTLLFACLLLVVASEVIPIGVVLPFSDGKLGNESLSMLGTIQLAVEEINGAGLLGINNTLELIHADSSNDPGQAFFAASSLVANGSVAVIGDIVSSLSVNEQYMFKAYKVPQISAESTLVDLSNKKTFPYFMRLCSTDPVAAKAIMSFVHNMAWKRVIAFVSQGSETSYDLENNEYGISVTQYSISLTHSLSDVNEYVGLVKNSDIGVVVVLTNEEDSELIIKQAKEQGLLQGQRAWIGGDGVAGIRDNNVISLLQGFVVVSASPGSPENPSFVNFTNKINSDSRFVGLLPSYPYQSKHYDAVFTIAYALNQMIVAGEDYKLGNLLLERMKNVSFQGVSGLVAFDQNGDLRDPVYIVNNYQSSSLVKVGNWSSTSGLSLFSSIVWPDGSNNTPEDDTNSKILKVGLLLPLTGDLHILAASWQSAIMYAIHSINQDTTFLPGYTISPIVKDSQASSGVAILEAFNLASQGALGVIGSGYSSDSETAQLVLRNFKIPQISGSATSDELSNKKNYPTFFRTVAVDSEQGTAMAQIVNHFNWRQIAVMLTDDTYSSNCYNVFSGIVSQFGVLTKTVQIMHTGGRDVAAYVKNLKESGALIFLLIALPGDAIVVLEEARIQGLLGSRYVWITSDGVATITSSTLIEGGYNDLVPYMRGLIGTIASEGNGEAYDKFLSETSVLDPAIYPGLTPPETYTTFFYDCIYSYAHGFKLMLERGWDLKNTSLFISAISQVNFTGVTGRVAFNEDFDRTNVNFAIVNWRTTRFEEVATWEISSGFTFEADIIWPNGGTVIPDDSPIKVFEENTLAGKIILIILASLACVGLLIAAGIFTYFMQSSVVHATNFIFAVILVVGGLLGYMIIVVNALSPPDEDLCRARVWVPCLAFALFYGALLSKYVHSYRMKKRTYMDTRSVLSVVVPVVFIELLILIIWTSIPSERPVPEEKSEGGKYVMWCSNSTPFVVITMVYKGLLMVAGVVLIILTGEYPSYYSESYYLKLTNWAVLATTIASVALMYILDGQVIEVSAVVGSIILIGLSLSLGFVFIPKCRLLLLNKEGCRDSAAL